jgi:WD40 repeat protein
LISADGVTDVWDAKTGNPVARLNGANLSNQYQDFAQQEMSATAGSPTTSNRYILSNNSQYLLTISGGASVLWNLHSGESRTLTGHTGSLRAIGFTPSSQQAITVGAEDSTVRLWNLPSSWLTY